MNNDTAFQTWVKDSYERNAAAYRLRLQWITQTVADHCKDSAGLNKGQASEMIKLLREVTPPALGKYPEQVTPEDKAWFATCLKPKWPDMLRDAENQIHKLC